MMPTNEPTSQNSVNGTGLKSLWEVTTLRPIAENTPINITGTTKDRLLLQRL